jgi:hypothetical protein
MSTDVSEKHVASILGSKNNPSKKLCLQSAFTLVSCSVCSPTVKMEATCSSETSFDFQMTTWHYILEDRQNSSVNIQVPARVAVSVEATGAGQQESRDLIPGVGRDSLSITESRPVRGPPSLMSHGYQGPFSQACTSAGDRSWPSH